MPLFIQTHWILWRVTHVALDCILVEFRRCWCIQIDTVPEQRRSITGRLRCISQEPGPVCQVGPPYGPASSHQNPLLPSPSWPSYSPHYLASNCQPHNWEVGSCKCIHQTILILCLHMIKKALQIYAQWDMNTIHWTAFHSIQYSKPEVKAKRTPYELGPPKLLVKDIPLWSIDFIHRVALHCFFTLRSTQMPLFGAKTRYIFIS